MDKVVISHIGLTDKDLILIRNLLRLNTTWFGNFELAEASGTHEGQILLIDQDQPVARIAWRQMQEFYPRDCVISIGKTSGETALGAQHLQRPLVFRRLTDALQQAVRMASQLSVGTRNGELPAVLIVDDSLPVRTFMKQKLFELFSGEVAIGLADCGERGVAMAVERHYDLVFMDVVMPGIDGYKACRQIKAESDSPVVMLTSKNSTLNRVKAHMSGCNGYMTKPPDEQILRRTVHQHMNPTSKDKPVGQFASAS